MTKIEVGDIIKLNASGLYVMIIEIDKNRYDTHRISYLHNAQETWYSYNFLMNKGTLYQKVKK